MLSFSDVAEREYVGAGRSWAWLAKTVKISDSAIPVAFVNRISEFLALESGVLHQR
jgi:hypothetical protein